MGLRAAGAATSTASCGGGNAANDGPPGERLPVAATVPADQLALTGARRRGHLCSRRRWPVGGGCSEYHHDCHAKRAVAASYRCLPRRGRGSAEAAATSCCVSSACGSIAPRARARDQRWSPSRSWPWLAAALAVASELDVVARCARDLSSIRLAVRIAAVRLSKRPGTGGSLLRRACLWLRSRGDQRALARSASSLAEDHDVGRRQPDQHDHREHDEEAVLRVGEQPEQERHDPRAGDDRIPVVGVVAA